MFYVTTRNRKFVSSRILQCMLKRGVKTMRAWQAFGYGGPEQLQLNTATRIPTISSPMDILVKVHASSVNPLDVRMLEGYGANAFNFVRQVRSFSLTPQEFPLTLGRDFSGTVVYVGKSVKNIKCGDEVWGATSPWENGSHADFLLACACHVSHKPKSLSHNEASSFPYAALTAWSAIKCFGGLSEKSVSGKRVLVTGASGGVGTFMVQLLKLWGADVTVTCSTDAAEMLQNLGVDNILDYQSPDFKNRLSELKGLDIIFDNVGGQYPELTVDLLNTWKGSKYVTVVSPLLKNGDDHGLLLGTFKSTAQATLDTIMSVKDGRSFRWAYFTPNGCALKTIAQMIDNKQVIPVIEKVFGFQELPQAYEKILSGHARGKVVINFASAEENKIKE